MYEDAGELAQAHHPRDLTAIWERLSPLETVNGTTQSAVDHLCAVKGITRAALVAQDARVALRRSGEVFLAFPGHGDYKGVQVVTAIKYRNLASGRRAAELGSTYPQANIVGNERSLDWFVAEGETDAARLWDLIGNVAAVMVLPAGAMHVRQEWFDHVPQGATLYLCHDADEAGDKGAAKLARTTRRSIRIRPPKGHKDWCSWRGTRDEFVGIVQQAKSDISLSIRSGTEVWEQLVSEQVGERKPVHLGWGSIDKDLQGISDGQVLGIAARASVGKTWMMNSVVDNMTRPDIGMLICTLEMTAVEFFKRQWAIYEGINTVDIETRKKQEKPIAFLNKLEHTFLCEKQLRMDEFTHIIAGVRSRLNVPLRCVYVDYFGLIGANGRDAYERASAIGKGLKELAKEERVAVIVAMQLSRAAGGGGTEVSMEMMRDSGVIEESVDFLLGVWRPELNPNSMGKEEWKDTLCVKVIKNRKGVSNRQVTLKFQQPSMKVIELAAA